MDSLRLIEIHNICKSFRAFTCVRMMDNTVLFGIVLLTNDCTVIVQEKNVICLGLKYDFKVQAYSRSPMLC